MESPRTPVSVRVLLVVLVLAALGIRAARIDAPFTNFHELDGPTYGNEVRNWHRHGLRATFFFPSWTTGRTSPESLDYHVTHWPVPLYFVYGAQKLLGIGAVPMPEWSLRLVPILLGTMTLPLLYSLLRALRAPPRTALLAVFFGAFAAGHVYFSQTMGCNFPITIFCMLLAFRLYLHWSDGPSTGRLAVFALVYAVALYCLWEAYTLFPVILLFHLLTRRHGIGQLLPVLVFVTAGTAALYGWQVSLLPQADTLSARLEARSSAGLTAESVILYGRIVTHRLLVYYSAPWTLAAAYGLLYLARRPKELRNRPERAFALALLVGGLFDVIFLSNGWAMHQYFVLGLFLFFAVSGALGIDAWLDFRKKPALRDPFVVALLGGFLAQSAFVIHTRYYAHTDEYPVSYEFGVAAGRHSAFGEEILTDLNVRPDYSGFYADRFIVPGVKSVTDIDRVRQQHPTRRFRYFVTTTPELAQRGIRRFQRIHETQASTAAAFQFFGIGPKDRELLERLDEEFPRKERDSFLFYDLEGPPIPPVP